MHINNEHLSTAIEQDKYELIGVVSTRLQKLADTRYADIDYERHFEREEMFLDALLQGLQAETAESFLTFVEQLSEQRADEGYTLQEFQEAFNVVEDALWEVLVTRYGADEALVGMLTTLSQLFRAAKDHLARAYYQKALFAERELEEVRRKFRTYRKITKRGHASGS